MIEVGVASPMAQGQAITITATKMRKAKANSAPPKKYQVNPDNKATAITADVPSEAELTPKLWGRLQFQSAGRSRERARLSLARASGYAPQGADWHLQSQPL